MPRKPTASPALVTVCRRLKKAELASLRTAAVMAMSLAITLPIRSTEPRSESSRAEISRYSSGTTGSWPMRAISSRTWSLPTRWPRSRAKSSMDFSTAKSQGLTRNWWVRASPCMALSRSASAAMSIRMVAG